MASPAHSETLDQALAFAYKNNPEIDAQRATLRATDEGVAIARSGYRPTISSQLSVSSQNTNTKPGSPSEGSSRPRTFQLNLTQPLFTGFQVTNAVNEAEANVRAGQQTLRNTEQTVLLNAATAYVDVVRDGALLRLNRSDLTFNLRELQATQDRFSVGEVTRTDVAQARAAVSAARSAVSLAEANLRNSRAVYRQVVGRQPANLREPPVPARRIPRSLHDAIRIGLKSNPLVIQALYQEQAARFNVDEVFGQLLPQAQLEASYTATRDSSPVSELSEQAIVTSRLTIPLYLAGSVRAQIRQAKQTHVNTIQNIETVKRQVRQAVTSAWSLLRASQAQLVSNRAQVQANQIALAGVREEERVGQRTLLDVLEAQQALLNAQVALTTTQRDIVVNAYSLISAIGQLDGISYGVAATLYDPTEHYFEVRREWWRISITRRDGQSERHDFWDRFGRHRPYKLGGQKRAHRGFTAQSRR
ncbi:MAG: TolC family outer membrane protein [Pseudomonadota bacterium]